MGRVRHHCVWTLQPVRCCLATLALLAGGFCLPVRADSTMARCDIYAAGADHAEKMISCRFSQRQGHVTIAREDGVSLDLTPVDEGPGRYLDQDGRPVRREAGLGDQGLIFRTPVESIYVYWSTAALEPAGEGNATAPFSTADFDATTLLRCRAAASSEFLRCPAGILRMERGQASVVVLGPAGEQFTINFMTNYVNATNRELDARLEGDTWIVSLANGEVYEVPLAAIEGG